MDGFVGRQAELRLLESALAAAHSGSGRLVTITGPPGVGKTRLCEEATDQARANGHTVVWGRCWTDGGAPALWPWQSILSRLCGDDATALLDGAAGVESVDLRRLSRFVAAGERLARACDSPTMLVIDDSHAADPGALLLTRFVARNLHHLPLVLVLTQRPGAAPPEAAPLLAEIELDSAPIVLGGFTLTETRSFLVSHGVTHRDPALVEAVHVVSEGSPLYLRRLVALQAAQPATGTARPPLGLPGVIEQSLRPLLPLTVRLLTQSALLGRSVSIAEAAAMADASEAAVRIALREATGAGLVTLADPESFTFTHDLVRQALAAHLAPDERLAAHARAAEIVQATIGPEADERLGRFAHHALQAASRSADDARAAVAACHTAARSMVRHFAYEQAVSLLAAAARLHDGGALGPVPAELLLDWAHAVLSCGALTDAGPLFDRAADAARQERNPLVFAEAALGVGGMWVNKHRDRANRARMLARLEEALAWLPETATVLRCRLATRQAAELAYDGDTTDHVLVALDVARDLGDRQALAEALSLTHHALLNPEHGERRLALADELIAVASAAGLEILTLVGVCRRTIDLFQLGDPRAERSMTDLRRRAELLSCRSVQFLHAAMEVMLLIRAGELTRAEERAVACFRLGTEVGDADTPLYHSAHLFAIRWLQGRGAELVDLAERTANSPALPDTELTFHATLALLAADAGQHDRARSALHRLTAGGLASIPQSSTWLACMFAVVEVAAALVEPELAAEAYDLLVPFAHLPVVPSMAIVCFGSTERSLGLAALTFGDTGRAVEHLERAVLANLRLANRPLTACARADLAEALRRHGDPVRAAALLDLAIAEATTIGMTGRADAWRATRRDLAHAITIRRDGERWLLAYRGRDVVLDDLVGMRYLARLVAHPGTEIAALDLVADGAGPGAEPTNHAVIDEAARAAYARRARELADALADARDNADRALVKRLELELDALTAEVERTTGINGRSRHFAGPAERARTAVRKAITRALDAIGAEEPEAADSLRAAVTTGYRCVYQPAR